MACNRRSNGKAPKVNMSENPLVHIPQTWTALQKANDYRRMVLNQLRSFDQIQWDGTPYGKHPDQVMKIYELNDLCPRDGWPVILMIHGGAWREGSKYEFDHIAPMLAKKGIMVCSMDYRLAPSSRWPCQLEDVLLALDFLNQQQVDPNRIALWGFSAGGHMALMAALERPEQIRCVVAHGAPTDLELTGEDLWGSCFDEEMLSTASPINHPSQKLPPTLLLHGALDRTVRIEHARLFQSSRPEECTLLEVPDGDHGLRWPLLKSWRAKRRAYAWIEKMMDLPARGSKWKRHKRKK